MLLARQKKIFFKWKTTTQEKIVWSWRVTESVATFLYRNIPWVSIWARHESSHLGCWQWRRRHMHCPFLYWTKKITPRKPKTLIIWMIRHLPGSKTRYAKTWRCKCPAALECDCRLEVPTHRQDQSKMVACLGKRRFIMQGTLNLWTVSWGRRWDDMVKIQ